MTQFKGTKGNWIVGKNVICSDEEGLEGNIICLNPNESGGFPESGKKWKANALLISKAPEMLEMLERLVDYYKAYNSSLLEEAKQLIKEATEL